MFDWSQRKVEKVVPQSLLSTAQAFGVFDRRRPPERTVRQSMRGTFAACIRARARIATQVSVPDLEGPGFQVQRMSGGVWEPVEEDHPWQKLIRNPSGDRRESLGRSAYDFWYWNFLAHDLQGMAANFLQGVPMQPSLTEVYPEFGVVRPVPAPDGGVARYVYQDGDGLYHPVPLEEVLTIRRVDPHSAFESQGMIEMLADYIGADLGAMRYQSESFQEGRPMQFQILDNEINATPETREDVAADIRKQMGRRRSFFMMPQGMKAEALSLNPEDFQMLEAQGLTHEVIYRVTGVPQGYFDNDGSNKATAETAERKIRRDTIQPLLDKVALQWTLQLTRAFGADPGALRVHAPRALQPTPSERETINKQRMERGVPAATIMEEEGEEIPDAYRASLEAPRLSRILEPLGRTQAEGEDEMPADAANKDVALNGAQVTAAKEIVINVAAGRLGRGSGRNMLMIFFGLSGAQADRILSSAAASPPVDAGGADAAPDEGAPPPEAPEAAEPRAIADFL